MGGGWGGGRPTRSGWAGSDPGRTVLFKKLKGNRDTPPPAHFIPAKQKSVQRSVRTAALFTWALGELEPGWRFCAENPAVLAAILKFTVCSAVGQTFIFFTISNFDPLPQGPSPARRLRGERGQLLHKHGEPSNAKAHQGESSLELDSLWKTAWIGEGSARRQLKGIPVPCTTPTDALR